MKLRTRGEILKLIKTNKKGITLVEVILTLALLSIVIGVVYSVFFAGNKSFEISKDTGLAQQDARLIAVHLDNELKFASKISKNDYGQGRYFSIELKDNNGSKTLVKTEYNNGSRDETRLLSKDWDNISIKLEQTNRTLKGSITVGIGNNKSYQSSIIIPLENINSTNGLSSSITLSDANKVYYVLPEDIPDIDE